MKLILDKYFTPNKLAKKCIDLALSNCHNITEIIEPSAGAGAFSLQIQNCIAYDIAPEHESVKEQDFLKLELPYKKGRLIIGNPPFGVKNTLSVQFFKKACKIADYIAFILPISQLNNNRQMYDFDLIKSIDLDEVKYTDRNLHCCLAWRRADNGTKAHKRRASCISRLCAYALLAHQTIEPDIYDNAVCDGGF